MCGRHGVLLPEEKSVEKNKQVRPIVSRNICANLFFCRVRSRLYSRLYSQERYQNTIRKSEFKELMEMKMKEPVPFSTEFDRLEKLSFDTIEHKTCVAELPLSRRRNR